MIEKDNIILDGAGHQLQGYGTGIQLLDRTNVTIRNLAIRSFGINQNFHISFDYGISLSFSSNNTICENQFLHGEFFAKSGRAINILSSSNNTICRNIIKNEQDAIVVAGSSDQNNIFENAMINNARGISVGNSLHTEIYHNCFINNTEQIEVSDCIPDNSYPSGGNYWSDYIGSDHFSGTYQNEPGSDGIGDTPYAIDEKSQDNYPLMNPPIVVRDIAIPSIYLSKTVVSKEYSVKINVMLANVGSHEETFSITTYVNGAIVNRTVVTLQSGSFATIALTWNTTGFAYGTYSVEAIASTVPEEIDTKDNTLTVGWIVVTILGDANGDRRVDGKDVAIVAKAFNTKLGAILWDPNGDVNSDGKVDGKDVAIVAKYFNTHYP
jgi:hypothetical protein